MIEIAVKWPEKEWNAVKENNAKQSTNKTMRWWGWISGDLGNVEYLFIPINLRSPRITCLAHTTSLGLFYG